MLERLRLEGKVACVTGGSRGLGREMALALSEAGASVCIASRTQAQLDDTAAFIEAKAGRRPLTVAMNVQHSNECDALIAATIERFGRLDIMVNNAGIGDRRGSGMRIWDLDDADWQDTIEVNLNSTFYCSRAAARHMRDRGEGGVILNVSSGTALRGYADGIGYGAAKAGVIALTKTLAVQLADSDIRVNCIAPGYLQQSPALDEQSKEAWARRGRFNPSRRTGQAWEMGPLAVFLCSDAASYVTGETFVIDGGGLAGGVAPVDHSAEGPVHA